MQMVTVVHYFNFFLIFWKAIRRWRKGIVIFILFDNFEVVNFGEWIILAHKFFKEIAKLKPNIDEVHITGTGQAQEQFMHFLADTAQYKNVVSNESTSNKMSDEALIEFIKEYYKLGIGALFGKMY